MLRDHQGSNGNVSSNLATIEPMDIQVELEEMGSVKRKLSIQIPAEIALQEFERVAREFKKSASLPGFRRGKVPLPLIKRRFEGDIRGEVVHKLVPQSYEQALRRRIFNRWENRTWRT